VFVGAWGLFAIGCRAKFSGPYSCETGYASCVNPDQNLCETDLTSDGANCGVCGKQCGLGAACTNSTCGAAATQIASLSPGSQPHIAVNASGIFWSDQGSLLTVPVNGGSPRTVATGFNSCGGTSFALGDSHVYFWMGPNGGGPGGLMKVTVSDGTQTTLVPNPSTGASTCPSNMAVDATNVYWAANQASGGQNVFSLYKVPIAGGSVTTLATEPGNGGGSTAFALSAMQVIFEPPTSGGGSISLAAVSIAGGPSTSIPILTGGVGVFTADSSSVYVLNSGCPCGGGTNGSNSSYTGPPTGSLGKISLDGSPPVTLAQILGETEAIAVDATHVYWSTDASVQKVSRAGGPATSIAGNLTGGASPYVCNGCSGSGCCQTSIDLAVDATSVYIADSLPGVNAILKVPK
jgi:hypothetical protein